MLSASMPAAHAARDQETRICGRGWLALNRPARPPNCLCLGLCHREAEGPSYSSLALPFDCFTSLPQHVPSLPSIFPRLAHLFPPVHNPLDTTIVNTDHAPPRVIPAYKRSLFCPVGCATTAQMRVCITDYNNYHFRHAPWDTVPVVLPSIVYVAIVAERYRAT